MLKKQSSRKKLICHPLIKFINCSKIFVIRKCEKGIWIFIWELDVLNNEKEIDKAMQINKI